MHFGSGSINVVPSSAIRQVKVYSPDMVALAKKIAQVLRKKKLACVCSLKVMKSVTFAGSFILNQIEYEFHDRTTKPSCFKP